MITFMSEECLQWQFWWWQCWLLFGDGGHNGDGVDDDVDDSDIDDVDTDPDHVQGVDLRGCFFSLQTWLAGCSLHTAQVSWLWWLRSLADDAGGLIHTTKVKMMKQFMGEIMTFIPSYTLIKWYPYNHQQLLDNLWDTFSAWCLLLSSFLCAASLTHRSNQSKLLTLKKHQCFFSVNICCQTVFCKFRPQIGLNCTSYRCYPLKGSRQKNVFRALYQLFGPFWWAKTQYF